MIVGLADKFRVLGHMKLRWLMIGQTYTKMAKTILVGLALTYMLLFLSFVI